MLAWFASHYGDLIVLVILGLIVGAVIASTVRGRKKGKCCGCSGCTGCTMAGTCQKQRY